MRMPSRRGEQNASNLKVVKVSIYPEWSLAIAIEAAIVVEPWQAMRRGLGAARLSRLEA